jgi:DNA-binding transcriptional LysR family regulator
MHRNRDAPSGSSILARIVEGSAGKSTIRLRQLRHFLAAADHGSFRKAAIALDINESSVSRQIRDLEDELGASLFIRHSGGVRLTVAAVGRADQGLLKVGIFSSLASGFLFNLLRRFGTRHPTVQVDLIDGNPSEHVAAVRQLDLDIAFITGTAPWDGCETEHLWCERVFVVLPAGHPLAAKAELEWPDLTGERFIVSDVAPGQEIHDYLVAHLAGLGHHPDIQSQHVGRDNILSLVAVGRGLTLTSEATTVGQFPGIAFRQLADEVLPFSMVWSDRNDNPACRRLLSMARAMGKTSSALQPNA